MCLTASVVFPAEVPGFLQAYSSKDLSGLTVDHKGESFREGQTVILTLKDAPVLDQDGDILENVNIVDEEKVCVCVCVCV